MGVIGKCQNCGGALPLSGDAEVVRCTFCGVENRIRAPEPPAPSPPRSPARAWQPPALAPDARPASRRGVAIAAAVLLGIGGFAFLVNQGEVLGEWYQTPCLVDANGDAVLDAAGFSGSPDAQLRLALVDGATGNRLFKGELYPDGSTVFCPDRRTIAVDEPGFKVTFVPAPSPERASVVRVRDRVRSFTSGPGCVSLELADGSTAGVLLPSGAAGPCAGDGLPGTVSGYGGPSSGDTVSQSGTDGSSYLVAPRPTGTPVLTVRASGNGVQWSSDLGVRSASKPYLALTPRTVVVYGALIEDDHYGVLVGLDRATGAQRYALSQGSHWSGSIQSLTFNGRYVLATWGFGLHAYDPDTGERAWHIGGR